MAQVDAYKVGFYNKLISDYLKGSLKASEKINYDYSYEALKSRVTSFSREIPRDALKSALNSQYEDVEVSDALRENIDDLGNNALSVTTGHQLNLFGGPIFFLSKIAQVIGLARRLTADTGKKVVPVFWMASEDHDFEEIQSINLFGRTITWEQNKGGAVGRLSTDSMTAVLTEVQELLGEGEEANALKILLQKAFGQSYGLSHAMRIFVNSIFGKEGLVILDGDNAVLKACFNPIVKREIKEGLCYSKVEEQSLELDGYKKQINPRAINLFYLEDGVRERIEVQNDRVSVLNTNLSWSVEGFMTFIDTNPEQISPNALLRPVYQEVVLPNVAYVGGAGEIAYWLQLPLLFESLNIEMPLPIVRTSFFYPNTKMKQVLENVGLGWEDLFQHEDDFRLKVGALFLDKDISFDEDYQQLESLFEALNKKGAFIDPDLRKVVEGEKKRSIAALGNLEKRFQKAQKRKHETAIQKVTNIQKKLLAKGVPHERTDASLRLVLNGFDNCLFLWVEKDLFKVSVEVIE